ncbi:HD domain-containing protein [Abyssisolibacter fermentans]|uniref:HD domain-containing protein n=1 Tax=Abyssisolibacter fermentans TaxID=1766203 RepID=UPI000830E894|nr:HD domain-containing protein [Abyssisolibacter fermentans]
MRSKEIIKFLSIAEKLKCELRHSWTSTMRQESVADHSWRLCLFSWILKDKLPEYDMDKVMKMCLFHDLGEALAGDIPSFIKNSEDELNEENAIIQILNMLDGVLKDELENLFMEMKEQKSREAKLFKALDKMEVVIQHNEAPIETWIPLEYELNKTYGSDEVKGIKALEELREVIRKDTIKKISG